MKFNITSNYSQPDPYVISSKGKYYMYVTGKEGVDVYVSNDFFSWERFGVCYSKEGEYEYWAPSIIEIDGKYYMYVSSMPIDKVDTHEQRIQVAVSDSPTGPFEFIKFILPPFSIDPHVVKSGNDLYIFYSVNDYEANRAGTLIVVSKMISPVEVKQEQKVVVRATLDEEIFKRDRFKKGQHWHTIEGAFYLRKGNYHYVMYSGNCYENENYFIGYSVAIGDSDDLTKLDFKKYPDDNTYSPLIRKNDIEEGTGHNSVLVVDGKTYVIYHGRDYDNNNNLVDKRTARYCEICLDKEIIRIIKR